MRQAVLTLKTIAKTTQNGKTYSHTVDLVRGDWQGENSLILRIDGGPGQWYLSTLFGTDGFGSKVGSMIYIDHGQNWRCINMDQIMSEVESLIGTVLSPKDFSLISVAGLEK